MWGRGVKVIEIDAKQQRRVHTPLWGASRRRKPLGVPIPLNNAKLPAIQECSHPPPRLTHNTRMEEFVEQVFMRHSIKGLNHIKKEYRKLLTPPQVRIDLPEQLVDVVHGGQIVPEARLVCREEFSRLQKALHAIVPYAFKHTDDHTSDGDEAVRRRTIA